jgi:protein involved in polysaccharide export with SLBB domain
MAKRGKVWAASQAVALGLLLLTGCSGGGLTYLFSPTNRLSDAARAVRQPVAPAVPRELDKHLLPTYIVEPGDVILVYPVELDSPVRLPGDQPVLLDGTINLGKYGQLVVAGHTLADIEAQVRASVEAQTKDAGYIAVRLISRISKVYYVLGEVNAPGAYPINGREAVLDGILAAGGLTDRASREEIILSRPTSPDSCRVVLPVCYREITQVGDTSTNYQLAPGDRIYVPARCSLDVFGVQKNCPACCGLQAPCPMPAGKEVGVWLGPPTVGQYSAAPPAALAAPVPETLSAPRPVP